MFKLSSAVDDNITKCTPNLLPCRIHHNGPVNASPRYWAPENGEADQQPEAYFRGRKLKGKEVKLPKGYKGVVVRHGEEGRNSTERLGKQEENGYENGDEDDEEQEALSTLQEIGSFDGIVLWGHESIAEDDDTFVKGLGEWIGFAEAMHNNVQHEKP